MYTTDQLVEELISRVDAGVISLVVHRTDDEDWVTSQWIGNPHEVIGLATELGMLVAIEMNRDEGDE
jgi:hypothetical protein